ncbi:MAG: four helix bundle protein [Ignavibacteria bacterium]|jgi:four helix bundle protein
MELEELQVYKLSMELGEKIWDIVIQWSYFEKDTIGKQLVKAADSVAANISEGYGRYHFKENINFCYYSRGSLFETKTWITKSFRRNLITNTKYEELLGEIKSLGIKLNNYINSIGKHNRHN